MRISEIKGYDLNKLNQLYEEFLKRNNPTKEQSDKFVTDYIDRCECCGELCFWEELEERKMWDGKVCKCCEECQEVVDEENIMEEDYNE